MVEPTESESAFGGGYELERSWRELRASPAVSPAVSRRKGGAGKRRLFLMPAVGYDFVPGNLAGALALERAGSGAKRLDIGYFFTGDERLDRALSGGTLASLGEALLTPAYTWRGGRLVTERAGRHMRRFDIKGRARSGLSIGGIRALRLGAIVSRTTRRQRLPWLVCPLTRLMRGGAALNTAAMRIPAILRAERRLVRRAFRRSSGGPPATQRARSRSCIAAEAFDQDGRVISAVAHQGINGYDFTGEMLAWAAVEATKGTVNGCGALGPVEGFGLRTLEQGAREAGIAEQHKPSRAGVLTQSDGVTPRESGNHSVHGPVRTS